MIKTQTNLIKFNQILLLILLYLPLFTSDIFLYPYVFLKSIIFRLIATTLIITTVFLLFNNKLENFRKDKYIKIFLLFLIILPIFSFFGVDSTESWWGGFERMEGGFYYFYLAIIAFSFIIYFRYSDIWKKVFWVMLSSSFLISIIVILQKFSLTPFLSYGGRIGGTLGNAAYLSSTLLSILTLVIFFFYKYKKYRYLSLGIILLNIIAIFISATRGSIVAIMIALFLAIIFALFKKDFLRNKYKKILSVILLLLIFCSISLFIFKDSGFIKNTESLRRISEISLNDATTNSRLQVWQYSYQGFLEKPIFGWGLENFDLVFNKYYDGSIGEEWFDRAHNNYIDILISGGMVSLSIYLLFIFFVFKKIYTLNKKNKIDYITWLIFTFGFLAYLIQNLFIFDTVNNFVFLFVFLALLYHIDASDKDNNYINLGIKSIYKKFIAFTLYIIFILAGYFLIIAPTLANTASMEGYKNIYLQNNNEAKSFLNKAIDYTPQKFGDEEILVNLADLVEDELSFGKSDNLNWTVDLIRRSETEHIKLVTKLASFYNFQGVLNKDISYYDKSIVILNNALEENSAKRDIYTQLGRAYILKGETEKGEENFAKAFSIRNDKTSLWNLLTVYFYTRDIDNVVKYGNLLIEKWPSFTAIEIRKLIPYYEESKDNIKLEFLLEKLIELEPDPNVIADMAIVKLRLNKLEEASIYAKWAMELDPEVIGQIGHLFNL